MKRQLLFLSLLLPQILSAQTFTEVASAAVFEGVTFSSIAFSDVDGDNDPDVLITGSDNSTVAISKLYTNDGQGNFTEVMDTPFDGVFEGAIAFADIDGDEDPDLLITGLKTPFDRIAKLYTNDGQGNFTEMPGTPFAGVRFGAVAFADVDGDNDPDVLITGEISATGRIAKLYRNNGLGNFSEVSGTPFEPVLGGSVAFVDLNGDEDLDVLITGKSISEDRISKLYLNNGLGNFFEVNDPPFDGVWFSSIAFADVDGDNDPDVLITGDRNPEDRIAKLYINDGIGNFLAVTGTPFEGVSGGSVAFSDVDDDNDPDVLITGSNNAFESIAKLYTNDGLGNFSELTGTPFEGVGVSSIAFSDVDGDNDSDVLITGFSSEAVGIAKLYTNDLVLTSANEIISDFNFKLLPYPNPAASNQLQVDLPAGQAGFNSAENGFLNIMVYDLVGQLLSRQQVFTSVGQQTMTLDISGLSAGSYLIRMDNGKKTGVARFVVP